MGSIYRTYDTDDEEKAYKDGYDEGKADGESSNRSERHIAIKTVYDELKLKIITKLFDKCSLDELEIISKFVEDNNDIVKKLKTIQLNDFKFRGRTYYQVRPVIDPSGIGFDQK